MGGEAVGYLQIVVEVLARGIPKTASYADAFWAGNAFTPLPQTFAYESGLTYMKLSKADIRGGGMNA